MSIRLVRSNPARTIDEEDGATPHEEITKAVIDRLAKEPKAGKDIYVQDIELPGFRLRRTPAGTIVFLFVGRVRGGEGRNKNKVVKRTIGRAKGKGAITVAKARAEAAGLRDALARGIDPADELHAKAEAAEAAAAARKHRRKVDEWTVEYALEDMLTDRAARLDPVDRLRPETIRFYRNSIGYVDGLAGVPVAQLTTAAIRQALRKVPTVATQAKARRALSGVCGHAIKRLELNIVNPVSRLDKGEFSASDKRTGYLTAAELPDFISKVLGIRFTSKKGEAIKTREAQRAKDYILLTTLLGCRKQELMRMEWGWINWESDTFTIPATITKNGNAHALPLTGWTRAILKARLSERKADAVYVFPGNVRGKPLSSVRDALAQAGGEGFILHDLRRTLSTHCENLGVSGKRLKAILNHADSGVTEGYIQRDMEQMRLDLTAYHDWLRGLLERREFERHAEQHPDEWPEQNTHDGPPQRWPGAKR